MSDLKLALHGALPGDGVVARSDAEAIVLRVRGPVSLGEALARTPVTLIGLVLLRDALPSLARGDGAAIVPVSFGAMALAYGYRAWALWSGASEVELRGSRLTARSRGLPWLRPRVRVDASRVVQIGVVEYEDVWRRKNSPHVTRFALVARLDDGARRVLARGCVSRDPLVEAERLMEARLGIVDAPIHERPRDALPVRTESLESGLGRTTTEHLLRPRCFVTVEAPAPQSPSYRTASGRASPTLTVATPRWLRARALAPFAAVALAIVLVAAGGLVALARGSTSHVGLLAAFAPLLAVALALIARGRLFRLLRAPMLSIQQGVLMFGALRIERDAVRAVRVAGERGRWSIAASTARGEVTLVDGLSDEVEARWLAERVGEALGGERVERS